ncbi:MAG: sigma-70 family RNA polymerase sigma factor [Devosia sp.]|uniref:sigma factor n=1 Tax=Devosia sp. TaxID=1871048 RepID=UPI0024CCAE77|nr:sigma factor [Devosia sp.]UYN98719.1 MAG: sigma-70 family RNA polymerase sigma factor [Devosia sp.]
MRNPSYAQLVAIARREAGSAQAEDVVQDALIIAVEAGRFDLGAPETMAWLRGVVRNRARMVRRSARRRQAREGRWHSAEGGTAPGAMYSDTPINTVLDGLSPALKALAALVLTGHSRAEIAYLLNLPDTALRQRIAALKRHFVARGMAAPEDLVGLNLDLAYGRIRDALLPALMRHEGLFASHDPDGHLFVVRRSQKPEPRQ